MRLYTAWQHVRGATAAPAGPGMTAGHRPAAPDPPGAASGPLDTTSGVDLAFARSHSHERCACRPRARRAANRTTASRGVGRTSRAAPAALLTERDRDLNAVTRPTTAKTRTRVKKYIFPRNCFSNPFFFNPFSNSLSGLPALLPHSGRRRGRVEK